MAEVFRQKNLNPKGMNIGDCTVRAIAAALGRPWEEVYTGLAIKGLELADMPSANHVWGAYLKSKGFRRHALPNSCPDCYKVRDFARDYPEGIYILAISGHVVCVIDGDWIDTWDSGDSVPLYYWERKE